MKKILSIILTLVMALGITVPAMAEGIELLEVGESEPTYVKIEIDPYGTEEVITNNNADNPETVMAYRFNGSGFNIYGKYDGKWKLTSFADYGFSTMIGIVSTDENGEEVITSSPVSFDREGKASIHNLVITLAPVFTDNGKTIDFRYTVENKGSEAVTYYLASHADVQIGSDDTANITLFDDKGGFKMVSDEDKDALGNGAQFNFFKEDTTGFWFGRFSVRYENVYKNYTVEEYIGDSGCAWHWKDTVAASSSNTHNVKIGIGGKGSEFLNSSMDYVDTEYGSAVLEQSTDDESAKIDFTEDYTLTVKVDGVEIINAAGEEPKYNVVVDSNDPYRLTVVFIKDVGVKIGSNIVITATQTVAATQPNEEDIVKNTNGNAICTLNYQIVEEELTALPGGVTATVDEVKDALKTAIGSEKEIKFADILVKKVLENGNLTDFSDFDIAKIPAAGIEIVIEYPAGTNAEDYDFVVAHYISSGEKAGEVELLSATETQSGLKVKVTSFSPFAIGYQATSNTNPNPNPNPNPPAVIEPETVTIVIDGTNAPERDEEAEHNPSTGAPVMNVLSAFAVIGAAASFGKKRR